MPTPDARTIMAAELALGVLTGEERAEALRRVLAEPGFAREVEAWRVHFATMFLEWPAVVPSDRVEQNVMRATHMPRGDVMVRRSGWAWATGVATLIAACLVLALALRPQQIVTRPAPSAVEAAAPLVAAITPTPEGGKVKPFAVFYDGVTGVVRMAGQVDVPQGKSAELWVIGTDGPPHSLGVMPGNTRRLSIGGGNLGRMIAGATLAVSVEPQGGSPTGLPTGPVVATGTLATA
jgi:anti-sigma-K factor RskA